KITYFSIQTSDEVLSTKHGQQIKFCFLALQNDFMCNSQSMFFLNVENVSVSFKNTPRFPDLKIFIVHLFNAVAITCNIAFFSMTTIIKSRLGWKLTARSGSPFCTPSTISFISGCSEDSGTEELGTIVINLIPSSLLAEADRAAIRMVMLSELMLWARPAGRTTVPVPTPELPP
ncbi:hypothetical protein C0J52_15177, partial [Blattella germanica]